MKATVDRLVDEKDSITGVVITSGKKTFFAGGDLKNMIKVGPENADEIYSHSVAIKSDLRRLETLGKPVVAAINGAALGGGLEIALATHHRVAADVKGVKIGLPEVTLGLLPGGGGVVRTVRMLGLQNALMQVLLQGQQRGPVQAKEVGLIDEVVSSVEELVPAAKAWIKANPRGRRPAVGQEGLPDPRRHPVHPPGVAANLPAFPANLRKQLKGAPMPAPRAIMAAAVEGSQVDIDNALLIEARYFTSLVTGQVAKNMIQAFFFDLQAINSGASRPEGIEKTPITKVGVLGAGMMGAGIAYVSAKAGFDVVLKDVTIEAANKGKAYSEGIEAKALSRGKTTEEKSKTLLDRITPTADPRRLRRCRLRHRGRVRVAGPEAQGVPGDRGHRRADGPARLEHVDPADHRPGDGCEASRGLHRNPLLLPRRQDAARRNHPRREDVRRSPRARLRLRAGHPQDADRRQRLAWLLHLARHRHVHQRGHRHAGGGHRARHHRAGRHAGRLPPRHRCSCPTS